MKNFPYPMAKMIWYSMIMACQRGNCIAEVVIIYIIAPIDLILEELARLMLLMVFARSAILKNQHMASPATRLE